ncbi:MAG: hypothetical protein JWQ48_3722 [Conexibacter sp.]|nr:hypothetical protein [Conexibacter sp.]
MTLVLTYTTPLFTAHVSDRLLTSEGSTFDTAANKTVVVHGRDGCIVMSYTGAAYIRGQTTDNWLAEQLYGRDLGPPGFGAGPSDLPDIGLALRRLAVGATALPEAWHRHCGLFAGGGFQWPVGKPRRARPVQWTVERWDASDRTYRAHEVLQRRRNRHAFIAIPGSTPLQPKVYDLGKRLTALGNDIDGIVALMIDAVREAAEESPYIGKDCMSVVITHRGYIRVQFFGAQQHTGSALPGISLPYIQNVPVAFSPWIIGAGIFSPPTEMIGTINISSQALLVEMIAPDPGVPRFQLRPQGRPSAPGWRSQWPLPGDE